MAIPSSQSIRSESKMVTERAVMPVDLFRAAIKGNNDVLIRRLRLLPEESQERKVTIEASHSALEEINTENQTVQSELQSATRFGDTILHLLVTEGHNELALMVFQRDVSLLKAQNKMFDTPLHCAAKVGNEKVIHNLIQSDRVVVKYALEKANKNGNTALHVAAIHNHIDISCVLMNLDPEVAYRANDKMFCPLYVAILLGHTVMAQTMLEVDPTLACTPFLDGLFPVHGAAHTGNLHLVMHFMEKYPEDAELRDPQGRNLFHIAAEANQNIFFWKVFEDASFGEMITRMNTTTDYVGNTPLHIAAMKGCKPIMRAIWEKYPDTQTVPNKQGLTPFNLSVRQVVETHKEIGQAAITEYSFVEDSKFAPEWFNKVMDESLSDNDKWEKTQVIGLGSVLITTVAFAAAFAIPGGYNQDNGTPVHGRRYMFRAFILANTFAFILGFLSLFVLLMEVIIGRPGRNILYAHVSFLFAASSMVVAFGLGLYVTLAPVCYPIAVLILVITMILGSPAVWTVVQLGQSILRHVTDSTSATSGVLRFVGMLMALYAVSFLLIFCLALV